MSGRVSAPAGHYFPPFFHPFPCGKRQEERKGTVSDAFFLLRVRTLVPFPFLRSKEQEEKGGKKENSERKIHNLNYFSFLFSLSFPLSSIFLSFSLRKKIENKEERKSLMGVTLMCAHRLFPFSTVQSSEPVEKGSVCRRALSRPSFLSFL